MAKARRAKAPAPASAREAETQPKRSRTNASPKAVSPRALRTRSAEEEGPEPAKPATTAKSDAHTDAPAGRRGRKRPSEQRKSVEPDSEPGSESERKQDDNRGGKLQSKRRRKKEGPTTTPRAALVTVPLALERVTSGLRVKRNLYLPLALHMDMYGLPLTSRNEALRTVYDQLSLGRVAYTRGPLRGLGHSRLLEAVAARELPDAPPLSQAAQQFVRDMAPVPISFREPQLLLAREARASTVLASLCLRVIHSLLYAPDTPFDLFLARAIEAGLLEALKNSPAPLTETVALARKEFERAVAATIPPGSALAPNDFVASSTAGKNRSDASAPSTAAAPTGENEDDETAAAVVGADERRVEVAGEQEGAASEGFEEEEAEEGGEADEEADEEAANDDADDERAAMPETSTKDLSLRAARLRKRGAAAGAGRASAQASTLGPLVLLVDSCYMLDLFENRGAEMQRLLAAAQSVSKEARVFFAQADQKAMAEASFACKIEVREVKIDCIDLERLLRERIFPR